MEKKLYTEEEAKKISQVVLKYTKKKIKPIARIKYSDDLVSLLFEYKGKSLEVYSFSQNKNELLNKVLKELKSPNLDLVLNRDF